MQVHLKHVETAASSVTMGNDFLQQDEFSLPDTRQRAATEQPTSSNASAAANTPFLKRQLNRFEALSAQQQVPTRGPSLSLSACAAMDGSKGVPLCPVCEKPAYQQESIPFRKKYFHNRCFACSICGRNLTKDLDNVVLDFINTADGNASASAGGQATSSPPQQQQQQQQRCIVSCAKCVRERGLTVVDESARPRLESSTPPQPAAGERECV